MSRCRLVIVDYGMCNLNSVKKALDGLNADSIVSSKPKDVSAADKIILPGVGHFGKAMSNLAELNLVETLNEAVREKKKPILGICLGMQLLAKRSEEGDADGLGWIDGEVIRFRISDKRKFKVPHMGWNRVSIKNKNPLMKDIPENSEFYFVHSYHVNAANTDDVLSETEYEYSFTSAVANDNIYGVQYHPEKSHDPGAQLMKNFIEL